KRRRGASLPAPAHAVEPGALRVLPGSERAPQPPADKPLIDARAATIRFGGLTAVSAFTLQVARRELVALIGPNGAGKTTVFNLLTGVYPPSEGQILVAGADTRGLKPFQITHLGIARTFQNI